MKAVIAVCVVIFLGTVMVIQTECMLLCPNTECRPEGAGRVCGTDGNTYAHDCMANCHGIYIQSVGASSHRSDKPDAKPESSAFLLLTLLTLTVFFCWTPSVIIELPMLATIVDPSIMYWIFSLGEVQAIVDPIICVLSLPDLRRIIFQQIRC
ncbi:uncharacterized protein LOC129591145 [Paramacrobiotus metropolitanus]|uniref:uncharacterized protein LOC129591145 n=1 Tax=Paramacrobiotus metropolitanus TaxID=2943436 RepID=UPI002445DA54|nr:uncharacterized protein LOC129591145 [Paramacrobiotus metropolitanus]